MTKGNDGLTIADKLREVRALLQKMGGIAITTERVEWARQALAALPDPEEFDGVKVLAHAQRVSFKLAAVKQERDELAAEVKALREGHRMKDNDNAHYEGAWKTRCDELAAALETTTAAHDSQQRVAMREMEKNDELAAALREIADMNSATAWQAVAIAKTALGEEGT